MSAVPKTRPLPVAGFLHWSETAPEGKFELHDGDGDQRETYHHTRGPDNSHISVLAAPALLLDPPGIEVDLSAMFED